MADRTLIHGDRARRRRRLQRALQAGAFALAIVYLVGLSVYLLTHGGWPTPDLLVPPLILCAIIVGRGWSFVFDWGPFLLLLISWQATADVADRLGYPVHMYEPAEAEQRLFHGHLPTVELQERFFAPGHAHWYDWVATSEHALHFVVPVAFGVLLWMRSRRTYWRYLCSVLVLFYLGFAGYALYPAAPPWLAGAHDVIPTVHRVAAETLSRFPATAPAGLAYTHMPYNYVAAIPSLHAGAPLLVALVLIRLWGWRALVALLYPASMGVSLVYLGEHYVVDVLAGYAAAVAAFALVWVLPDVLPVRAPRWTVRSVRLPVSVRWAGHAALPLIAVASVAVIASSLRPASPAVQPAAMATPSQAQARRADPAQALNCDQGIGSDDPADDLLTPVAGRYVAYLVDLDSSTCFALAGTESFPPPPSHRLGDLAARAPRPLSAASRPRGAEYSALQVGAPSSELIEAGLAPDRRYLLVIALADVEDVEVAAQAVDELAARTLAAEPLSN